MTQKDFTDAEVERATVNLWNAINYNQHWDECVGSSRKNDYRKGALHALRNGYVPTPTLREEVAQTVAWHYRSPAISADEFVSKATDDLLAKFEIRRK